MIPILALGCAEKLINSAIHADPISQEALGALSGKILRIICIAPDNKVDVLFCDDHIRFEPVTASLFEPKGGAIITPDCTLTVDNPKELLALMTYDGGNLPIAGDHRLLLSIKDIITHFQPSMLDKLEALVGMTTTSYLAQLGDLLPIKTLFGVGEQINTCLARPSSQEQALDERLHQKRQELLRLQADIERAQAQLNQLTS